MVSFPFHLPATALVLAMTIGLLFSSAMAGRPSPPSTWAGRPALAVVPAVLAVLLAGGGARKMAGDLHLAAGERHFAAAGLDGASFHLEKGINLVPWPGKGNLYLGLVRVAAGNQESARVPLEKSLQESPTFEGFLALAEICIDQGKYEEADRHLAVVEGCKPIMTFRIQAAYLRGLAELRQGRQERARLLFRELLKSDPDNQRAWLALGYQEALGGNQGQARIYYRRALEIIERKLQPSSLDPGGNSPGIRSRLERHRQAALKALQSVS
jgi:tetratricopeptide (TPR) repeat protein